MSSKNIEIDPALQTRILRCAYITSLLNAISNTIQTISIPYLLKLIASDAETYGYYKSINALCQLIGSPICGYLTDVYGTRFMLSISLIITIFGHVLVCISFNSILLIISCLPRVLVHVVHNLFKLTADVTDEETRVTAMGRLGLFQDVGVFVGSLTSGVLIEKCGVRIALLISIVFNIINAFIISYWVPHDTNLFTKPNKIEDKKSISFTNHVTDVCKAFRTVIKQEDILKFVLVKLIVCFVYDLFWVISPYVKMDFYNLTPQELGFVAGYVGILGSITKGYFIIVLTKYFTDYATFKCAIVLFCVGFYFLLVSDTLMIFCIACIPFLTIAKSIIDTVLPAILSKRVPSHVVGSALSLVAISNCLERAFSAFLAGNLYQHYGFHIFGFIGYIVNMLVLIYLQLIF